MENVQLLTFMQDGKIYRAKIIKKIMDNDAVNHEI
jgi:hypothetical protein